MRSYQFWPGFAAASTRRALWLGCAMATVLFVAFLAMTLTKPLIDDHSFRQTQTAISVFHMLRGGPWIAYFTPVLGAPWSLPFEAPVYHWSVALVAQVVPLEGAGRLVSALYLLGAVFFGCRFLRLITPPDSTIPSLFALLALTAPLHLFWGRAFLIETCALCFGAAFLYFGARYLETGTRRYLPLALVTGVLCALAKATTWPAFALALLVFAGSRWAQRKPCDWARVLGLAVVGALTLLAAWSWTGYADAVKAQNALGAALTSSAVRGFIYGTLAQRLGPQLWKGALVSRMLPDILGTLWWAGALGLVYALVKQPRHRSLVMLGLLASFLLPLLVFTNLHIVHNYYQVANASLLLMATAIGVGTLLDDKQVLAGSLLALALVSGQLTHFWKHQFKQAVGPAKHEQIVAAARFVRDNTPADSAVLAIGVDWSSIVHFYAERKGIAPAWWFRREAVVEILADPPRHLDGLEIAAVVDCRGLTKEKYEEPLASWLRQATQRVRSAPGAATGTFGGCQAVAAGVTRGQ